MRPRSTPIHPSRGSSTSDWFCFPLPFSRSLGLPTSQPASFISVIIYLGNEFKLYNLTIFIDAVIIFTLEIRVPTTINHINNNKTSNSQGSIIIWKTQLFMFKVWINKWMNGRTNEWMMHKTMCKWFNAKHLLLLSLCRDPKGSWRWLVSPFLILCFYPIDKNIKHHG